MVLRSDLSMGAEELTNSSLMTRGRIFTHVGSGIGHTLDPTSSLVKVTILYSSDYTVTDRI